MMRAAFPDLRIEVEEQVGEAGIVVSCLSGSGTHRGEFMGIPATGRATTTNGVDFFRLEGGRQAEHWGGPDMASFLQQLGVIPRMGLAAGGSTRLK